MLIDFSEENMFCYILCPGSSRHACSLPTQSILAADIMCVFLQIFVSSRNATKDKVMVFVRHTYLVDTTPLTPQKDFIKMS